MIILCFVNPDVMTSQLLLPYFLNIMLLLAKFSVENTGTAAAQLSFVFGTQSTRPICLGV